MPTRKMSALTRFREQAGYTKEKAAVVGRTRFHTIDNIERGKAPLTAAIAKALEASTGCSAKSLLRNDNPLQAVNGETFSKETLEIWISKQVSDNDRDSTADMMALRARLLIKAAAAHSPALYRSAFVELRNKLEEVRENLELRFPQIEAAARAAAVVENKEFTRAELDAQFKTSEAYKAERHQLEPKKKIPVRIEIFPFWADVDTEQKILLRMELIDSLHAEMKIWHIQRMDGSTIDLRCPKFRFTGNFDISQPTGN